MTGGAGFIDRLSAAQWRVVRSAGVTLLGFDERNRPVVEAMTGIPQTLRRWALTRSGDPTDISGEITPKGGAR